MAKELIYKVRIDYDASSAVTGADRIEDSQDQARFSIKQTEDAFESLFQAQRRSNSATNNFSRNQSRANQVLFNFGDIANDAQQFSFGFSEGLRAIGNNIGFAAEGFSNLNTKSGGFSNTLQTLKSSLLGPGGIILAINAAVSIVTLFGEELFSTSEDAQSLDERLEGLNTQVKTTVSLIQQIRDVDDPFGIRELELTIEQLSNQESVLDVRLSQIEEINRGISELSSTISAADPSDVTQQQVDKLNELRAERRKFIEEFGTEAQVRQQISDLQEQQVQKTEELERKEAGLNDSAVKLAKARREQFEQLKAQAEEDVIIPADIQIDTEGLRQQIQQARTILQDPGLQEGITLQTTTGGEITPEEQAANEQRRQNREETRRELNDLATRTAPKAIQSINEVALRGTEVVRSQAQLTREEIGRISTIADQAGQAISLLFGQSKAAAIASAIVNGAQAITKTFAEYGFTPFGIAAAASQAAITAAQISTIKSTEPGGAGNAGGGNVGRRSVPTQAAQRRAADTGNRIQGVQSRQQQRQPIVIQGDINTVATAFKVRQGEAQIRRQQQ